MQNANYALTVHASHVASEPRTCTYEERELAGIVEYAVTTWITEMQTKIGSFNAFKGGLLGVNGATDETRISPVEEQPDDTTDPSGTLDPRLLSLASSSAGDYFEEFTVQVNGP